ncbi:histidine biosynthesis bifunctional protein hisie [Heliomicrobium modesticaldum Ice1]|uniref:Histidine biosynthesis bifunctional protein HisIE n=1 Tax=Heliobacterium modesticaldum (strain ATCC 51547 / Ice1) TaxID=498761 RepID=B0TDM6_HELMI|nr:bifunctional phosphoribosyl-AMP cyclohydrolase/phosphoribosyl-ATP diphosphatase HisIE [Heliomicrobium modesticaldum]ABZ85551.1 histidine biosynthesis bifunctional protein hisie [Heliomicrobium modesticaldum Ice1]
MARLNVAPSFIDELKFDAHGLIPAVIQDAASGRVLMVAYMNRESIAKTLETGQTHFYSRSRKELWHKGATSGHFQQVTAVEYDCDRDCLLWQVEQVGAACHEGSFSCFRGIGEVAGKGAVDSAESVAGAGGSRIGAILEDLAAVIASRQKEMPEGSYTTYLFTKGQDKILKKVGEEAAEVIIASKNNERGEIVYEASDLIYHLLVLLRYHEIELDQIAEELKRRR